MTLREQRRDLVFDRILEAGGAGTTKVRLGDALRAAQIGTVKNVPQAIEDLRKLLSDECILWDPHLQVYRAADDLLDAEMYRRWRVSSVSTQLKAIEHYAHCEQARFGSDVNAQIWEMVAVGIQRAREDLDRAALLTFGRLP